MGTGNRGIFCRAPLHLLTTATPGELRHLQPDSVFQCARFRPNFIIDTDETGFVENDWVNKQLVPGSVRCQVIDHKPRCVMVTRCQGDLPKDIEAIRAILKNNDENAGVELRALESGTVRCGDEIVVGS